MLVQTYSHLIPPSTDGPAVLSSPTTSSYIPDIPLNDFSCPQVRVVPSDLPRATGDRRERRMRTAPYPLTIPNNLPSTNVQSRATHHRDTPGHHTLSLHSPRPISYFNAAQAFDNVSPSANAQAIAFTPGAHGTILGPFHMHPESAGPSNTTFDEITATQLAFMQTRIVPSQNSLSPASASSASVCAQPSRNRGADPSLSQIRMPRVPSIPQARHVPPAQVVDLNTSATRPHGIPHLPDAIPPETSQVHFKPNDTLSPPSETFPTPVELLGELSQRDAEAAERDSRRTERRKVQLMHDTEKLGFSPTDPDSISTHDKKRLYLDCLEQYVIYLHKQLRLAGYEPVPIERVSSGRGLTSRSIRTMIVHLKNETAKLHSERREAEQKYKELRAQLGEDADLTAPLFMGSRPFAIQSPTAGPMVNSSTNASKKNVNGEMERSFPGTRRPSITISGHADPEPLAAPEFCVQVPSMTGRITG